MKTIAIIIIVIAIMVGVLTFIANRCFDDDDKDMDWYDTYK